MFHAVITDANTMDYAIRLRLGNRLPTIRAGLRPSKWTVYEIQINVPQTAFLERLLYSSLRCLVAVV